MAQLSIQYLSIDTLIPRPGNPRTHSKEQLSQIAKSIERFGFTNPVLIEEGGGVVAGHGRVEAAKQLGMTQVPCVKLADMSEAEVRAYVIADNRLAENAGWDRELLAVEFAYLGELELDFDLTITGFELPEIDILLGDFADTKANEAEGQDDIVPEHSDDAPVTQAGDIWLIGKHRLICGDALKAETYEALMGEDRAQVVFADPPFNVPIAGHVSGLGKIQHREFAMASGEMSREEFTGFLASVFGHLAQYSADGSIHYHCMDWRHATEILAAGDKSYIELKNLCVWAKTNGGMGSLYRSQHELVFVFKSGTAAHINNVELGKHGRNRTNVWSYAGANSFGESQSYLELHPTVKPVAMIADAIRDTSHRGQIVLDPFAGSGSTLIGAERTGRMGSGIEIDPAYCDVIVKRMSDSCGLEARLQDTGDSFAEAQAARADASEELSKGAAECPAHPMGEVA